MVYELPSIPDHNSYGNAVPPETERDRSRSPIKNRWRDFEVTVTMIDKERLKTWRVIETKTRD